MPDVHSISIDADRFDRLAARAARDHDADVFLAGGDDPSQASIVGLEPCDELVIDAATSRDDLAHFAFGDPTPTCGFISYPYGMVLRGLPGHVNSRFPLGHLKKYSLLLEYQRSASSLRITEYRSGHRIDLEGLLGEAPSGPWRRDPAGRPGAVVMSLNRDEYTRRVRRTIEYIRAGYTYQLNLTVAFQLAWPNLDDSAMFFDLWREHPAAFYARIVSGPFRVLSTSPERFVRVRDGHVTSEPIKGTTRLDCSGPEASARLTSSVKESAELSMIVDLIRNDISYHCQYGTVKVDNHKATFVVDDLVQMYSRVSGRLRPESTCLDLLLDAFPCGSVTGCPKRKTMELIAELEPHSRDVYCGTIFVIRGRRDMESSVAIRSGYYDADNTVFRFYAGSGIVALSDPEAEYRETLDKAAKFIRYIDARRS